jgi:hypothetical protein
MRDSWPHFTVSDSRLPKPGGPSPRIYIPPRTGWPGYTPRYWVPFSSPPTTRKATVEVFDPASTQDSPHKSIKSMYILYVSFHKRIRCWVTETKYNRKSRELKQPPLLFTENSNVSKRQSQKWHHASYLNRCKMTLNVIKPPENL